ncbi:hypothetical protein HZC30_01805 [Candidatus Woesearchaeota archaeon]|nr:hypothetical protein [Candidatus Woesearchaeota archaeon]
MIDLSTRTIRHLFEQQVKELTMRTTRGKENSFDYQLSGEWIKVWR